MQKGHTELKEVRCKGNSKIYTNNTKTNKAQKIPIKHADNTMWNVVACKYTKQDVPESDNSKDIEKQNAVYNRYRSNTSTGIMIITVLTIT